MRDERVRRSADECALGRIRRPPQGGVREVRWRADGARLATASFDQTARLLDPETGAVDVVR